MSLKKWIATRWIPPGARAATTYRVYLTFLKSLLETRDISTDENAKRELENASAKLGEQLAKEIRDAFNLKDTIIDAVDAWKIGCVASGIKARVLKEGDAYIFHHPVCPMHRYFTEKGMVPCSTLCLPTVTAIAKTICPECDVEIIHGGDLESTCIKSIKPGKPTHVEDGP
jgi:hypothetical protein